MIRINLLPWRAELREEQKKEFMILLGLGFGLAAMIALIAHTIMSIRISNQHEINNLIQSEIRKVEARIKEIDELKKKRESLVARMNVIQSLQRNRPLSVRIFDELARVMPEGIYLMELECKDNRISLVGKAESNTQVSLLMRKIDASEWLSQPHLSEIKWEDKDKSANTESSENDFKLECLVKGSDDLETAPTPAAPRPMKPKGRQ